MKHVISLHRKAIKHAHRQRGASLLEGIAYLGIAAIVVIGAVALMRGAFSSAQSNSLTQDVVSLRTNIRKLHVGQSGYAGLVNATVINAGAVPDSLIRGAANALTNAWNGAVNVGNPAATNSQFTITYVNVPQDVCVNTLTGATGWISISVNGVNVNGNPIPAANAANACNGNNNQNTIVWTAA